MKHCGLILICFLFLNLNFEAVDTKSSNLGLKISTNNIKLSKVVNSTELDNITKSEGLENEGWTVASVVNSMDTKEIVFDPKHKLSKKSLEKINEAATRIIDDFDITLRIFLLDKISTNYYVKKSPKSKPNFPPELHKHKKPLVNLEKFLKELSNIILPTQEQKKNSFIVVIAIKEELIRIKIGENIKSSISQKYLSGLISSADIFLEKKYYKRLIMRLLQSFYFKYKYGKLIQLIGSLFMILVIVLFLYSKIFSDDLMKVKITKQGLDTVKRLKELLHESTNLTDEEIYNTYCVVCLELLDKDTTIAENNARVESEHQEDSSNSNINLKEKCSHKVHNPCLKRWRALEKECPICYYINDINQIKFNQTIAERLLNIQVNMNPSILDLNLQFFERSLDYSLPDNSVVE